MSFHTPLTDRNCLEPISHDIYLIDNFNEDNSPSDLWEDIRGGIVSTIGCLAGGEIS